MANQQNDQIRDMYDTTTLHVRRLGNSAYFLRGFYLRSSGTLSLTISRLEGCQLREYMQYFMCNFIFYFFYNSTIYNAGLDRSPRAKIQTQAVNYDHLISVLPPGASF